MMVACRLAPSLVCPLLQAWLSSASSVSLSGSLPERGSPTLTTVSPPFSPVCQIHPQHHHSDEAIKWPELNAHSGNDAYAGSIQNVGRAGLDTASEANLSRLDSASNYSTPDFGIGGHDPYAVPPLPHLNPNQPYRDDPSPSTGFYDPYRGPVPGTIESGTSDWHPEAYPMTQLGGTPGRASPGPDFHGGMHGRASPAPQYGGRASPGPQVAYGGRASPAPQAAFGRTSPGPHAAYAAGPGN